MGKPVLLKIAAEIDRVAVAGVLIRNGYRVETAKRKQGKCYQYYLKCELLDSIVLPGPEDNEDDD